MISLRLRHLFAAVLLAGACSGSAIKVVRLPDGTRELTCDMPLWKCIARVDDYCKGSSFEVLYAHDKQHRYGAPGAEVESRTSGAVIHCLGLHAKPLAEAAPGASAAAPAASEAPSPAPAVTPLAPAPACVPGTTQVCVGPGACSGGQACLADGSGFSTCDCGTGSGTAGSAAQ